jgi:uncharacterized protein (DUF2147 family)
MDGETMIALLAAAVAASIPNGAWLTQDGSALVRVEPCGSSICGTVAGVLAKGPGIPRTDVHNPDPALRSRPLVGLAVLGGFTWSGREWTNGHIYDPKTGKTYRSRLSVSPDGSLKVSGCVLFICQNQRWTAAH